MSDPHMSMVIDAVDGRNEPIGQIHRNEVFAKKANFRTVHILIRSLDRTSLLLQELPPNHPRSPARLGSSVAGYLHAGESYQSAARRKLKEELGINRVFRLWPVDLIEMHDEGVSKFIQIYTFPYDYSGQFDRSRIENVSYYRFATLDRLLIQEPDRFTATFLHVYRRFREIPKWQPAR